MGPALSRREKTCIPCRVFGVMRGKGPRVIQVSVPEKRVPAIRHVVVDHRGKVSCDLHPASCRSGPCHDAKQRDIGPWTNDSASLVAGCLASQKSERCFKDAAGAVCGPARDADLAHRVGSIHVQTRQRLPRDKALPGPC